MQSAGYNRYVASVKATLAYWEGKISTANEEELYELFYEFPTISRTVKMGFSFEESWEDSAEFAFAIYPFVEKSGRFTEWISTLQLALDHGQPEHERYPHLLSHFARLHKSIGQLNAAKQLFEETLHLNKKPLDERFQSTVRIQLASCLIELQQFEAAKEYLQRAYTLLTNAEITNSDRITLLVNEALVAMHLEQEPEKACTIFGEALQLCDENIALTTVATILNGLGHALIALGRTTEARQHLRTGINQLAVTESPLKHFDLLNSIAYSYYIEKKWQEAAETMQEIPFEQLQALGYIRKAAQAMNNLGDIYIELGNFNEAERHIKASITAWETMDNNASHANTRGTLGKLLIKQGSFEEGCKMIRGVITELQALSQTAQIQNWIAEFEQFLSTTKGCQGLAS